jgi:hypothetical protein
MKLASLILFIGAVLWLIPLLLFYLARALNIIGVEGRNLDPLVMPYVFISSFLDNIGAPSFLTSSNPVVSLLTTSGELVVFGIPFCILVCIGLFLSSKNDAESKKNEPSS